MSAQEHIRAGGMPLVREAVQGDFSMIEALLAESAHLYPDIVGWWNLRVVPETRDGRRVVAVAEQRGSVEGVFIGKRGRCAKLCTLRLREPLRRQGIGKALAAQGLALLLRSETKDVHVTISAALGPQTSTFFENLGFREKAVAQLSPLWSPDLPNAIVTLWMSSCNCVTRLLVWVWGSGLPST